MFPMLFPQAVPSKKNARLVVVVLVIFHWLDFFSPPLVVNVGGSVHP